MQYISAIFFAIGNSKVLCEDERSKNDVYVECGESLSNISKLIKRSVNIIYSNRKKSKTYNKSFDKNGNPHLTKSE